MGSVHGGVEIRAEVPRNIQTSETCRRQFVGYNYQIITIIYYIYCIISLYIYIIIVILFH